MAWNIDIDEIIELLKDGERSWNVSIADKVGINAAILYNTLSERANYLKQHRKLQDGWFYCNKDYIYSNTLLKYDSQRRALNKLADFDLIELKKVGNKRYYRIINTI